MLMKWVIGIYIYSNKNWLMDKYFIVLFCEVWSSVKEK